jgi:uncharacterized protein (TIGR02145 family)
MKLNTTSYANWNSSTYNDGNSSGFSALPAGNRVDGGGFLGHGFDAFFWEASEVNASSASCRGLDSGSADLGAGSLNKANGFSVRCLRDD